MYAPLASLLLAAILLSYLLASVPYLVVVVLAAPPGEVIHTHPKPSRYPTCLVVAMPMVEKMAISPSMVASQGPAHGALKGPGLHSVTVGLDLNVLK